MEQNQFDENYGDFPIDPFDAPIPGESLTNDPNDRKPWEQPPKFVDVNEALQELFMNITEEDTYPALMDQIRAGFPIDELTQYVLFKGYTSGYWNTDLMTIMIEPTMYLFIALAEHNGIYDYLVYDGEETDISDEDAAALLNEDANRMAPKRSKLQVEMTKKAKDVVPDSLLAQVEQVGMANNMGEE